MVGIAPTLKIGLIVLDIRQRRQMPQRNPRAQRAKTAPDKPRPDDPDVVLCPPLRAARTSHATVPRPSPPGSRRSLNSICPAPSARRCKSRAPAHLPASLAGTCDGSAQAGGTSARTATELFRLTTTAQNGLPQSKTRNPQSLATRSGPFRAAAVTPPAGESYAAAANRAVTPHTANPYRRRSRRRARTKLLTQK